MNENKWIDNPWITIVEGVGANSWDGKMRWILITKTTMVVNFNLQNSYSLYMRIGVLWLYDIQMDFASVERLWKAL